ncbi:MAG: hypothetical protein H6738_24635 [Alphaproteobacteria bacterium]|nr:hypothetical protein [Alphaproteobacteria bacterium]MCB9699998.1 hypothetical protein [Alphaproteobacteria bacterium]
MRRLDRIRRRFLEGELPFLELDGLGLTEVPAWALERDLVVLSLKDNALATLPRELALLESLEELLLTRNALTEVPAVIRELQALTELALDHNAIEVLPDWLADLPALRWVSVTGNPAAQRLPAWWRWPVSG